MSLVKNLKQNAGQALVATGSGIAGGFGSRAIVSAIFDPAPVAEGQMVKTSNKWMGQLGAVAAGIAIFASVDGDTTGSTAIKSAALGMSIMNGLDLATAYFKTDATLLPNNTVGRAVRGGLGLGCPCESGGNIENRYYPSLAQPIIDPMEGYTMAERIAYRDAMLGRNGVNPLLQVNDNAWRFAIAS